MNSKTGDKTTDKTNKADDIRRMLANPGPLYFAAGVIDKIRETAPERLAAVRKVKETDPKAVQERVAQQAKETQSRLASALSGIDEDLKKLREADLKADLRKLREADLKADLKRLREQAQHLALQSVGVAAEYVVKAREGYDGLAERGRGAMQTWRGEHDGGDGEGTAEKAPREIARERGGTTEVTITEGEDKPRARAATKPRTRTSQAGAAKKAETGRSTTRRSTAAAGGTAAKRSTSKTGASKATPKTVAKKTAEKKAAGGGTAEKAAPKQEKQGKQDNKQDKSQS
ncbi:hypothetical protein [Streptomyces carminius]|uniref:hypothetical protein n=1 Tax=Streptomyces carminius TaxID=2665496 RepID=UPI0018EC9535|nr:hypothetical protein [Streptomyces carminius]